MKTPPRSVLFGACGIAAVVACIAILQSTAETAKAAPTKSGLAFKSDNIRIEAKSGEEVVTAKFNFKNEGKGTVRITDIESNCACLRAESDQNTYEPGQSGTIEADFSIRGKFGTMKKTLLIHTRGIGAPTPLHVEVVVPEILLIEPKMVEWAINEEPKAKKVSFKVLREKPIHIKEVVSSRSNMSAKLTEVVPGKHYEIEMKPGVTSDVMLGVVRIETDCEIREQARQMAFFTIADPD